MTIIHSVGDVLSRPQHPTARRKSQERGMLPIQPYGEETGGPPMSHNHRMGLLQSNCSNLRTIWRGSGGTDTVALNLCANMCIYIHTQSSYRPPLHTSALSPKGSIFLKSFDLCCPNLLPMTNSTLTWHSLIHLALILLIAW